MNRSLWQGQTADSAATTREFAQTLHALVQNVMSAFDRQNAEVRHEGITLLSALESMVGAADVRQPKQHDAVLK